MSWSINLSGKKNVVHAEMRNAIIQMQQGLAALEGTDNEEVTVAVSGSASVSSNGACSISSSHMVSGVAPKVSEPEAASDGKTPGPKAVA